MLAVGATTPRPVSARVSSLLRVWAFNWRERLKLDGQNDSSLGNSGQQWATVGNSGQQLASVSDGG